MNETASETRARSVHGPLIATLRSTPASGRADLRASSRCKPAPRWP